VGIGMLFCLGIWMGMTLVLLPWWHGLQVHGTMAIIAFPFLVQMWGMGLCHVLLRLRMATRLWWLKLSPRRNTPPYTIPVSGAPNQLITLSVADVNGDGKPDLIVHVDGQEGSFALINNGSSFDWSH
jgi:hypothetical protein